VKQKQCNINTETRAVQHEQCSTSSQYYCSPLDTFNRHLNF